MATTNTNTNNDFLEMLGGVASAGGNEYNGKFYDPSIKVQNAKSKTLCTKNINRLMASKDEHGNPNVPMDLVAEFVKIKNILNNASMNNMIDDYQNEQKRVREARTKLYEERNNHPTIEQTPSSAVVADIASK